MASGDMPVVLRRIPNPPDMSLPLDAAHICAPLSVDLCLPAPITCQGDAELSSEEGAPNKKEVKQQMKVVVGDLEMVLGELKTVMEDLKTLVSQIDVVTSKINDDEVNDEDATHTDKLRRSSTSMLERRNTRQKSPEFGDTLNVNVKHSISLHADIGVPRPARSYETLGDDKPHSASMEKLKKLSVNVGQEREVHAVDLVKVSGELNKRNSSCSSQDYRNANDDHCRVSGEPTATSAEAKSPLNNSKPCMDKTPIQRYSDNWTQNGHFHQHECRGLAADVERCASGMYYNLNIPPKSPQNSDSTNRAKSEGKEYPARTPPAQKSFQYRNTDDNYILNQFINDAASTDHSDISFRVMKGRKAKKMNLEREGKTKRNSSDGLPEHVWANIDIQSHDGRTSSSQRAAVASSEYAVTSQYKRTPQSSTEATPGGDTGYMTDSSATCGGESVRSHPVDYSGLYEREMEDRLELELNDSLDLLDTLVGVQGLDDEDLEVENFVSHRVRHPYDSEECRKYVQKLGESFDTIISNADTDSPWLQKKTMKFSEPSSDDQVESSSARARNRGRDNDPLTGRMMPRTVNSRVVNYSWRTVVEP